MAKKNRLFPTMEYRNGCLINQNGDISICYAIDKRAASIRSAEECIRDGLGIVRALAPLPARIVVHFQDRFYRKAYVAPQQALAPDEVQEANDHYFAKLPYLDHQAYLFVTITAGSLRPPPKIIPTVTRKNLFSIIARDETGIVRCGSKPSK